MKIAPLISLQLPCFVVSVLLSLGAAAPAADGEKDTPPDQSAAAAGITATGKVFSVEPGLLSVAIKDIPTPVQFSITGDTPVQDEKGVPIPMDLIRAELPVTVHYIMEGDKMVAQHVVVSRSMIAGDSHGKPAKLRKELADETIREESSTTASEAAGPLEMSGSLSSIEQTISIVPRGESLPTMCVVNNSTRFVNIAGKPVGTQMLTAGMTMTVKSVRDGKRLIAQEIIFHGNPSTMAAGSGNQSSNGAGGGANGSAPSTAGSPDSPGTSSARGNNRSNNVSGSSGGFSDLPLQGYILPGQLPGQIGPRPVPISGGTNPNQETNPGQNAPNPPNTQQPGANPPNVPQPGTTQPNVPQPGTTQPNTPPAGGTTTPAKNKDGNPGAGGNNTSGAGGGSSSESGSSSGSGQSSGGSSGSSGGGGAAPAPAK